MAVCLYATLASTGHAEQNWPDSTTLLAAQALGLLLSIGFNGIELSLFAVIGGGGKCENGRF